MRNKIPTIEDKLKGIEKKLNNEQYKLRARMIEMASKTKPNLEIQEMDFQTTSRNFYLKYMDIVNEVANRELEIGCIDKKYVDGVEMIIAVTNTGIILKTETPSVFPNNEIVRMDVTYEGMVKFNSDEYCYARIARKEQECIEAGRRKVHIVFDGTIKNTDENFIRHYVYCTKSKTDKIFRKLERAYLLATTNNN